MKRWLESGVLLLAILAWQCSVILAAVYTYLGMGLDRAVLVAVLAMLKPLPAITFVRAWREGWPAGVMCLIMAASIGTVTFVSTWTMLYRAFIHHAGLEMGMTAAIVALMMECVTFYGFYRIGTWLFLPRAASSQEEQATA